MDFMVKTAMAIEREIDDTRNFCDAGAREKKKKKKDNQPSSSSVKKHRTSALRGF